MLMPMCMPVLMRIVNMPVSVAEVLIVTRILGTRLRSVVAIVKRFVNVAVVVVVVVAVVVVVVVVMVVALYGSDLELFVPGVLPGIGATFPRTYHGLLAHHTGHLLLGAQARLECHLDRLVVHLLADDHEFVLPVAPWLVPQRLDCLYVCKVRSAW